MIGIIGAGNMGRAIALRIKAKTIISDVDRSRLRIKKGRILVTKDNISLTKRSKVIILAVKPQHIKGALKEIAPFVKDKLVISIAAGVKTGALEEILGRKRIVRAMPNMPAMVGKGITALAAGRFASKKDLRLARGIFLNLGEVVEVKESLMDAVTALSGSGPAYYFLFTDLVRRAGIRCGLKKDLSEKLAMATFIGAAESCRNTDISMQDFVKKVASKGGTTEAALKVFKQKGLEKMIVQAVKAACTKSRKLTRLLQ